MVMHEFFLLFALALALPDGVDIRPSDRRSPERVPKFRRNFPEWGRWAGDGGAEDKSAGISGS